MNELENKISTLVKPICDEVGVELAEVNFKKECGELILEILIDKETYVSTDDTTEVSEKLGIVLDELDLIKDPYILEVSSVGLEKELKTEADLEKAIGKYIHVDLYDGILLGKVKIASFEGTLKNKENDTLFIEVMNKTRKVEVLVELKQIKFIRLAVKF